MSTILYCFLLLLLGQPALGADRQFRTFFPGWKGLFEQIIRDNCSTEYTAYNTHPISNSKWPLLDCILDNFSETRKGELTSAGLVLGLSPMILQAISPTTAETSLLFSRRPFLALLLAASSTTPGVLGHNAFSDPLDALVKPPRLSMRGWFRPFDPHAATRWYRQDISSTQEMASYLAVILLEYIIAIASAGNVAVLAWQLGVWNFFASGINTYDPALWTYCALLIHLCGYIEFMLRFKSSGDRNLHPAGDRASGVNAFLDSVRRLGLREITPAMNGTPVLLKPRRASIWAVLASWIMSIAPILQVLYGTVLLSGSMLLSMRAARQVLFRYLLSAVVARGVLSYELTGMREVTSLASESASIEGYQLTAIPEVPSQAQKHESTERLNVEGERI